MSDQDDTTQDEDAQTFEVPEDLTGLSSADLETLASKVEARGRELAGKVDEIDDDSLQEAEELSAVAEELDTEIERRQTELAAKTERANSALARFAADEADDEDDETIVEVADEETTVEEAATDELAADELADDDADEEKVEEPEVEQAATRRQRFRGASPGSLKQRSKAAPPKSEQPHHDYMVATSFAKDPEGTIYETPADVAKALFKKRMAFGNNIPAGTTEQISVATGEKVWDDETPMVLGMDPQENLIQLRGSREALVASGTQCTPQNQLYDFFRLAQPIRDVEDALPTVQAPRGGIRYIQANCTLQGADAIGVWGTGDPASPGSIDPVTGEKPFDTVTCPNVAEVLVEAVSKGMVFDNLQYRTFPELIENFMEDVAVQFTLTKQRYYLDAIDRAATVTTGIGAYGAARALLYDLTVAAVGYRKRQHMPRGARLQVLIPDWAMDLWKMDLFYDGDNGLSFMNVPDSEVTAALASRNLDVTWYYDEPTQVAADQTANSIGLTIAQAAGALNDFAPVVVSFLYAPGTWVKLDGGSLDVGLYRDHSLNKTNDFAMFMEEWLGIAEMGCETIRIESAVCADGSRAPYAEALRTCATYGS
jgi:hypothetical protein